MDQTAILFFYQRRWICLVKTSLTSKPSSNDLKIVCVIDRSFWSLPMPLNVIGMKKRVLAVTNSDKSYAQIFWY